MALGLEISPHGGQGSEESHIPTHTHLCNPAAGHWLWAGHGLSHELSCFFSYFLVSLRVGGVSVTGILHGVLPQQLQHPFLVGKYCPLPQQILLSWADSADRRSCLKHGTVSALSYHFLWERWPFGLQRWPALSGSKRSLAGCSPQGLKESYTTEGA